MKDLSCLRCGKTLAFLKREKIQLGQTGFVFGDWPNLIAGSLEAEIYYCRKCGKLEFYLPDFPQTELGEPEMDNDSFPPDAECEIVGVSMEGIPQVQCPVCGYQHDFDYPRCPKCDYLY